MKSRTPKALSRNPEGTDTYVNMERPAGCREAMCCGHVVRVGGVAVSGCGLIGCELNIVSNDTVLAQADAAVFKKANPNLGGQPRVLTSKHGVLSMHWGDQSSGVLIVFVGDGIAYSSVKKPGGLYAMSDIESPANGRLPDAVLAAICEHAL